MSYCRDVKKEIISSKGFLKRCCARSELAALLLYGSKEADGILFQTDIPELRAHFLKLVSVAAQVRPDRKDEGDDCTEPVSIKDGDSLMKVFSAVGHELQEAKNGQMDEKILRKSCCLSSFISGAFLACGTVTNPDKGYHLEFDVPTEELANVLSCCLEAHDLMPKTIERSASIGVYFKESTQIEDVLNISGAKKAAFELMDVKVFKDVRNAANRARNCDTANIEKMINAAQTQCEAIREIDRRIGLDSLPDQLRLTAELRLNNPDLPLSELCKLTSDHVSRSGLNHRLNRLIKIKEELSK